MFNDAKAKLASLFGQLADIQKDIDASARKVVDGIVRLIEVDSDESPSSREALAGRDFSLYQEVSTALASDGFASPEAFEPTEWMSRPVESRTLVEYALGDAGSIVAAWFAINGTETRPARPVINLFTLFEDGTTLDTVVGSSPSMLPSMDDEHEQAMPDGTPAPALLAQHRAGIAAHGSTPRRFSTVDEYLASRKERTALRRAYRQGLGLSLVERYIQERFTGDRAEVGEAYLESIRKHPEWYKYANGHSDASTPVASAPGASAAAAPMMPLSYLMSETEDGRRTHTTFGLLFSGLPELILTGVAANHCRAARVLATTVVAGIARSRAESSNEAAFLAELVSERGARITLSVADAIAGTVTQADASRASGPFDVRLSLRGFTADDEPSMLHVDPLPEHAGSFDVRLREACARLGVDVPLARGADSADDAMREAHELAVARLDEVRARWTARAATGEKALVKFRAARGERGEYVWLEVRDWRDDALDGEVVTPAPRVGMALGQTVTIERSLVYDQMVLGPAAALPGLTDVVATDYGMDM